MGQLVFCTFTSPALNKTPHKNTHLVHLTTSNMKAYAFEHAGIYNSSLSSNLAHYGKADRQVWKEKIPRATQQQRAISSSEDLMKNVGRYCKVLLWGGGGGAKPSAFGRLHKQGVMKWIVQPHVKVMQGTDRITAETCAGDSSMEPKVSLTVGKREAAEVGIWSPGGMDRPCMRRAQSYTNCDAKYPVLLKEKLRS